MAIGNIAGLATQTKSAAAGSTSRMGRMKQGAMDGMHMAMGLPPPSMMNGNLSGAFGSGRLNPMQQQMLMGGDDQQDPYAMAAMGGGFEGAFGQRGITDPRVLMGNLRNQA